MAGSKSTSALPAGKVDQLRIRRCCVFRAVARDHAIERQGDKHEVVVERSWGIPPPTLTVETTTTSGWKRSGTRTDVSAPGGGQVDYARVREAVEKAVAAEGHTDRTSPVSEYSSGPYARLENRSSAVNERHSISISRW